MRRRIPFIAALLCLLMLFSLLPATALANNSEIVIVESPTEDALISEEEMDGEIVDLPGEADGWQVPEEELRPFYGEYGWLQLALNRPLQEQIGHQHRGVACACYALAYCRTLLDGKAQPYSDFNLGTSEDDAWCSWAAGNYDSLNFTEAYEVYERIVEELCQGKPVVILVNGARTTQHYVAIVGFENVRPGEPLTAANFRMLDPCAADYEAHNLGAAQMDLKKLVTGEYQLVVDRSGAELPLEAHKSSYLSSCRVIRGCTDLQTARETQLQSLPCSAAVDADSAVIGTLPGGEQLQCTALVKNTRGEYWYRGVTADGSEGYVFAADCTEGLPLYAGLSLSHKKLPQQLRRGEPFMLGGELSAGGNLFSSVTVEVYADGEPRGEPLMRATLPGRRSFCLLEESNLADALPFEQLGEGEYCLYLSAVMPQYSCTDGRSLQREDADLLLLIHSFSVGGVSAEAGDS